MAFLDLQVMLPFFLVLAIVYGALEVAKVFENRGVKGIIAVVIAFFSVSSAEIVAVINSVLPYAALFFVGFFFLAFLASFFKEKEGGDEEQEA